MEESDDTFDPLSSYLAAYHHTTTTTTRQGTAAVNDTQPNNTNSSSTSAAIVAEVSPPVSSTPSPQRVAQRSNQQQQEVGGRNEEHVGGLRPLEQLLGTKAATTTTTSKAQEGHTVKPATTATTTTTAKIHATPMSATNSPAISSVLPQCTAAAASTTSLEFQRQLALQQQAQAERERLQLREELQATQAQLATLTRQYNAQQAEQNSLAHRYSVTMTKLTNAEAEVRKVEAELVAERSRGLTLRDTLDRTDAELKEAQRSAETWKHKYELELEQHNQLRESQQAMLIDRRHYLPTAEVEKARAAQQQAQQVLLQRILSTLNALRTSDETAETGFFVARSAVLSAATDLSSRVARAEAGLKVLQDQMERYQALESETNEFVLGIMSENKAIWEQWNALRGAHEVHTRPGSKTGVAFSNTNTNANMNEEGTNSSVPSGGAVSQHRYLTLQLEGMTERLQKAQQLVEVQTALVRAHEQQMTALQETNAELQNTIDTLKSKHAAEVQEQASAQAAALESTQNALQEARNEIAELQQTVTSERGRVDETVRRLRDNQAKVQEEYEQRLEIVERERTSAVQAATTLTTQLEDTTEKLQSVQEEYTTQRRHWSQYTNQVEQVMGEHVKAQLDQVQAMRVVLEHALEDVRTQLEKSERRARDALRDKLAAETASETLRVEQRVVQSDLAQAQQELSSVQSQLSETSAQLRTCVTELHEWRRRGGEAGATVRQLQAELERAESTNKTLTEYVEEENKRQEQRLTRLQEACSEAESARDTLRRECEQLHAQLLALQSQQHNEAQLAQDKEQLMQENLRLHEAYERITSENVQLSGQLEQLRGKQQNAQRLSDELHALQEQLRALPELRQAAEAAVRAAQTAEEETNALRRERDAIARRLESVLMGNAQASKFEEQFSRVLEDAQDAVKRLGGQLRNVTSTTATNSVQAACCNEATQPRGQQQTSQLARNTNNINSSSPSARKAHTNNDTEAKESYHVFSNTQPTPTSLTQQGPSHLNARLARKSSAETNASLLDTSGSNIILTGNNVKHNATSQNVSTLSSAPSPTLRKKGRASQEPSVMSEPLMRTTAGEAMYTPQRPWKG